MTGFYIKIANGLLESKHCLAMGEAVWLYMWLQDKNTSVNENGIGKVLGNKPVKYDEDIKPVLGISRPTYSRWINKLRDAGYINTMRTPAGLIITITKAKKFTKRDVSNPNITKQRDVSQMNSDVSKTSIDVSKTGIQYKTIQGLYKDNTNTYVDSDKPKPRATVRTLFFELVKTLGFSDKTKDTDGRLRKLKVRLNTFTPQELMTSAQNLHDDAYMQGDNPSGKKYGTIDYLIRSDENVDKYLNTEGSGKNVDLKEVLRNAKF